MNDETIDRVLGRIKMLRLWLDKASELTERGDQGWAKRLDNRLGDVELECQALREEIKAGRVDAVQKEWLR
jgi:hypothetical protein